MYISSNPCFLLILSFFLSFFLSCSEFCNRDNLVDVDHEEVSPAQA